MSLSGSAPVLVVDDDRLVLALVADALTTIGQPVVTARTVMEAEALLERRPLLALLDFHLPAARGDALCRTIRLDPVAGDLPIVMITGRDRPDALRRSFAAGADDFLYKPLDARGLTEKVRAVQRGLSAAPPAPRRLGAVIVASTEPALTVVFTRLLIASGAFVRVASSGRELGAILAEGPAPRVVLLDVELPGALEDATVAELSRLRAAGLRVVAVGRGELIAQSAGRWAREPLPLFEGLPPFSFDEDRDELLRHLARYFAGSEGERPRAPRVRLHTLVEFRADESGDWRSGISLNVSEGGLFVRTLDPLPAGPQSVELSFQLSSDEAPLRVRGVVPWSNPFGARELFSLPFGMGVRFTELSERAHAQLAAYVERQLAR